MKVDFSLAEMDLNGDLVDIDTKLRKVSVTKRVQALPSPEQLVPLGLGWIRAAPAAGDYASLAQGTISVTFTVNLNFPFLSGDMVEIIVEILPLPGAYLQSPAFDGPVLSAPDVGSILEVASFTRMRIAVNYTHVALTTNGEFTLTVGLGYNNDGVFQEGYLLTPTNTPVRFYVNELISHTTALPPSTYSAEQLIDYGLTQGFANVVYAEDGVPTAGSEMLPDSSIVFRLRITDNTVMSDIDRIGIQNLALTFFLDGTPFQEASDAPGLAKCTEQSRVYPVGTEDALNCWMTGSVRALRVYIHREYYFHAIAYRVPLYFVCAGSSSVIWFPLTPTPSSSLPYPRCRGFSAQSRAICTRAWSVASTSASTDASTPAVTSTRLP